jgi:hypothetical protein
MEHPRESCSSQSARRALDPEIDRLYKRPEPASFDERLLAVLCSLDENVKRIADALDPPAPDLVGTPYVAHQLGVTTTWIADLIRHGEIPGNCLVPGTGNGKPWKFYRERIEKWIASR